jgi:hypothetical protein
VELRGELRPDCPRSDAIRPRGDDAFRAVALPRLATPDCFPPVVSFCTGAHEPLDAFLRGTVLPSRLVSISLACRFCFWVYLDVSPLGIVPSLVSTGLTSPLLVAIMTDLRHSVTR